MPAIWFTLNPSDLLNPIVCRIAGEEVTNVIDIERRNTLRNRVAVRNPVACARFFKVMMDGFFEKLVRTSSNEKGVFGEVDAYIATTETNGRGGLHAHGMLWLKGNLELPNLKERIKGDQELRKYVISYMEEIVQSCVWAELDPWLWVEVWSMKHKSMCLQKTSARNSERTPAEWHNSATCISTRRRATSISEVKEDAGSEHRGRSWKKRQSTRTEWSL
jgi:hypothetical protein